MVRGSILDNRMYYENTRVRNTQWQIYKNQLCNIHTQNWFQTIANFPYNMTIFLHYTLISRLFGKYGTVWCRYNTVYFLQNPCEKHPIACP